MAEISPCHDACFFLVKGSKKNLTCPKKNLTCPSCDEEWRKVDQEYGNTEIETLIQHYGHSKRSERFKLMSGQEFLQRVGVLGKKEESVK